MIVYVCPQFGGGSYLRTQPGRCSHGDLVKRHLVEALPGTTAELLRTIDDQKRRLLEMIAARDEYARQVRDLEGKASLLAVEAKQNKRVADDLEADIRDYRLRLADTQATVVARDAELDRLTRELEAIKADRKAAVDALEVERAKRPCGWHDDRGIGAKIAENLQAIADHIDPQSVPQQLKRLPDEL